MNIAAARRRTTESENDGGTTAGRAEIVLRRDTASRRVAGPQNQSLTPVTNRSCSGLPPCSRTSDAVSPKLLPYEIPT